MQVTINLDIYGSISSGKISTPYVDTSRLTNLPREKGNRTFGVFYQLLRGATPQEQSYLSLLKPNQYEYLQKSETFDLPSGLNVDDAASADDFREAMRVCGIKGKNLRGVYQILAACLLLGNLNYSPLEGITNIDVLEDACTLLDLEPEALSQQLSNQELRDAFVQDLYRLLVEWVVGFINVQLEGNKDGGQEGAQIEIVEVPSPAAMSSEAMGYGAFVRGWVAEALQLQVMKETFDDTRGLNAEMIGDSIQLLRVPADTNSGTNLPYFAYSNIIVDCVELMEKIANISTTLRSTESLTEKLSDQMFSPCYRCHNASTFSIRHTYSLGDWISYSSSSTSGFGSASPLEALSFFVPSDSFLNSLFQYLPQLDRSLLSTKINTLCQSLGKARIWTVFNVKPSPFTTTYDAAIWDVSLVSSQVRSWHLAQHHAKRKSADYTTDFTHAEFYDRYASIFPRAMELSMSQLPVRESIVQFLEGRKLPVGEWFVGHERVWIGELGWENLEGELDDCIAGVRSSEEILGGATGIGIQGVGGYTPGLGTPMTGLNDGASGYGFYAGGTGVAESREGLLDHIPGRYPTQISSDDFNSGYDMKEKMSWGEGDMESNRNVEVVTTTPARKLWVVIVWLLTWPIPGFVLKYVGRMKRKDVQMAWREKVTICFFIFVLCGTVIFYIIFFQKLLCPEFDKVQNWLPL